MDIQLLSSFILYFCMLTGIGLLFYKKNRSAAEFMIGDRSVNYWVTAIATQASDMGAWLFLGFPAAVYAFGLFQYWAAIGLIVGMFLTWHYIAPALRTNSERYQSLTLSSYLNNRFADATGTIGTVSALFSFIFFPFYIASGLVGLSILFESAFGIPYHFGIIISLVTTAAYTLIGGFIAVAWCDFFQGIFLLLAIILVPLCAFFSIDGINAIIQVAQAKQISLSLLSSPADMFWAITLAAGWGLGYFGQPHILVNFMGIDDAKKIKYAKRVGMTWQILVLTASGAIGFIGIAFFKSGLQDNQLVFINMTTALFNPFIAGFILCAIIAATLSTTDSLILVGGSTFAQDIYKPLCQKQPTSNQLLWISRLGSIALSFIALAIAWNSKQSVYDLVNYAWSGLGSSFGPLIITSLYSKNITKQAALTGIIVGGLTSALWHWTQIPILPLVPGFFLGFAAIWLTSLITKR